MKERPHSQTRAELCNLQETAHLMRSPENARRLLSALSRALNGEGKAQTPDALARSAGLTGK